MCSKCLTSVSPACPPEPLAGHCGSPRVTYASPRVNCVSSLCCPVSPPCHPLSPACLPVSPPVPPCQYARTTEIAANKNSSFSVSPRVARVARMSPPCPCHLHVTPCCLRVNSCRLRVTPCHLRVTACHLRVTPCAWEGVGISLFGKERETTVDRGHCIFCYFRNYFKIDGNY